MKRVLIAVSLAVLIMIPLVISGCKGKVEKESEMPKTEATVPTEETVVTQAPVTESAPAQVATQETIPPTAAVPPAAEVKTAAVPEEKLARNKDIQTALKAAGFYTGSIDGKMGPKTKKAVAEFQKAKGLKADGRVGSKTWAELEKYLKK